MLSGTIEEIPDILADADYEQGPMATVMGYRSTVAVPMLKDGRPIGAIAMVRPQAGPFSPRQIELVRIFADQAVIAIENTRLFEEVQARTNELAESLEYQTATSDILNVISRSPTDVQPVFDTIAANAVKLCDATFSMVGRFDGKLMELASTHNLSDFEGVDALRKAFPRPPRPGGANDEAILTRTICYIPDVWKDPKYQHQGLAQAASYRSILSVPILRHGTPIGTITVTGASPEMFNERQIELLKTFADQAVIAIENTRLFNEIVQKGRELEIASQHKSQFVANMSHELRTPLAAILGYAELMQEGFYEPLGQKSLDALARVHSNGKHLLGLINTVLDIAKIESGQFTLNMAEYALESVVETVRSATESLAQNKKLALKTEVAKSLPIGPGDEQRLTQVLLNLVGNAIKFTDIGEVCVTAKAVNGHFSVSVADTGPGIPEQEQKRIFEQFHQIDSSLTKAKGGTGLGLAIAKQIVEMHGGRIWVESTVGKGSTFQMEIPTRAVAT